VNLYRARSALWRLGSSLAAGDRQAVVTAVALDELSVAPREFD
jgi:hypothetical protein